MLITAIMGAMGGAPGVINDNIPSGSNEFSAALRILADGTGDVANGAGGANPFDWVTPATEEVAAFYEVRVDVTSGAMSSGTTGQWLQPSQSWILIGAGSVTFTLSFRERITGRIRSVQEGITLTVL